MEKFIERKQNKRINFDICVLNILQYYTYLCTKFVKHIRRRLNNTTTFCSLDHTKLDSG